MHEKRSILALHGFTGCGADFDILKNSISDKTIAWTAPDLHAETMPTSPAPLINALTKILNSLTGTQKIIVGYSMGGRIALHLAQAFPQAEKKLLILISASPGLKTPRERELRIIADNALADEIDACGNAENFYQRWREKPIIASQEKMPQPWRSHLLRSRATANAHAWAESLRGIGTGTLPPLWDKLTEISVPTLLITGELDEKFSRIADEMAAALPRSRHEIIPKCGHSPHLEATEKTAKIIQNFIESQ